MFESYLSFKSEVLYKEIYVFEIISSISKNLMNQIFATQNSNNIKNLSKCMGDL